MEFAPIRPIPMPVSRLRVLLAALCCASACVPPPGSSPLRTTEITGEWTGTFESSWGTLPIRATLANQKYTNSISGSYSVDGQRATGTVGGSLQTYDDESTPALFHGTLDISYSMPDGKVCRSTTGVTSGSALPSSVTFLTDGFVTGNCQDAPMNVRITLRRSSQR